MKEDVLADFKVAGGQGRAGIVAQFCLVTLQVAADAGADQVDRAKVTGTGGGEPAAEEHPQANLQAVSKKGGTGVIAHGRCVTVKAALNAGALQADRTRAGVAGDPCSAQVERAASEPVSGQRRLVGMLDLASSQADEAQPGTPGEYATLKEAIFQLKVDIRGDVFQVKPTDDPGTPKA